MELIGSIFFILALAVLVGLFVARPFLFSQAAAARGSAEETLSQSDQRRSSLLAERDRILTALQELEFDNTLGKVPEEDYPVQRAELMRAGAAILRELDQIQPDTAASGTAEERIAAAVAARRADAAVGTAIAPAVKEAPGNGKSAAAERDPVEDIIAARRRAREEKSAGFCPHCGKPVQKSDKFCARCGASL